MVGSVFDRRLPNLLRCARSTQTHTQTHTHTPSDTQTTTIFETVRVQMYTHKHMREHVRDTHSYTTTDIFTRTYTDTYMKTDAKTYTHTDTYTKLDTTRHQTLDIRRAHMHVREYMHMSKHADRHAFRRVRAFFLKGLLRLLRAVGRVTMCQHWNWTTSKMTEYGSVSSR